MTFEQYLQQVHAKTYTGTDDDMSDDFYLWLVNLDAGELMQYADEAIQEAEKRKSLETAEMILRTLEEGRQHLNTDEIVMSKKEIKAVKKAIFKYLKK